MSVSPADWRRWALLTILTENGSGYFYRTSELVKRLEADGWDVVLPAHGRFDSIHRALKSLERRGYVERTARPALWAATWQGVVLHAEFIRDNPNITPERVHAS